MFDCEMPETLPYWSRSVTSVRTAAGSGSSTMAKLKRVDATVVSSDATRSFRRRRGPSRYS
jgi:hypothetical protein